MHSQNVAHHDLKPANILIDSNGRLKLTDFGLSQIVSSNPKNLQSGTKAFLPPEVWKHETNINQFLVDIYSLGVTFYMMWQGKIPWKAHTSIELASEISEGKFDFFFHDDPAFEELITELIVVDPLSRPSIQKILSNPIFIFDKKPLPPLKLKAGQPSQIPFSCSLQDQINHNPTHDISHLTSCRSFLRSNSPVTIIKPIFRSPSHRCLNGNVWNSP